MKIILKWQIIKENIPISACAIDPVHDQMVIGVGKSIIVVDLITGNELRKCEKHTQDVTCLAYRKDGNWFASGSKDNIVFLWDVTNLSRPTNKITFNDPLIQLAYNPCILSLIGLSKTSLAIYKETVTKGGTNKFNLSNTATCVAWTSDGLRFALGFENGIVSIRDKENDKEIKNISFETNERIWCLSFSATRHRNKEYVLYVGTWEKNLYIVELFNYSVIDCKKLNSDPICFGLFKEDYFLLGSNNNEVNFYTKEGINITSINENINDWVLQIKPNNKHNSIVACTNDGRVLNYQINFQIVHAIHNEKYVYRQNLMDIIIHNLSTNFKSKIKCKKYIKKLAVYKNLVGAQLADRINIYELNDEGTSKSPKFTIKYETDLNLILLTSNHLLVCMDARLISYELNKEQKENSTPSKEWTFEAEIKYLRVIGGAKSREALLAGLKNGEVYMIYIDNQFPVLLYQHDIPIRSLDISLNRKKLAVVDENHDILVIDLNNKNIIWKDEKAKSVAFNTEIEDMISYWYDGYVNIKTGEFPPTSEKMNGVIVGFRGTKVFLLQSMNNISVLDISHSNTIMKYTENKDFQESYKVACLGATDQEWLFLGFEALLNFDFVVAVNCFKKVQDIRLINLVFKIENDRKEGTLPDDVLKGDILCNLGEYHKAADIYIKSGHPEKAVEMYSLLKMWSEAMEIKKKYLQGKDTEMTDNILLQQADWLLANGKYMEAADLYLLLGKKKKAIEIYGDKGMLDKLIEICRGLNKEDASDLINLCGFYFRKHKHYQYATEAYLKLGDTKALVIMNVELMRWEEAFLLAQGNKKLLEYCHLQYAEYLISQDKFREAQQAYKKAGRTDLSMKLLQKLIDNAVYEKRHKDAACLFIQYSSDALTLIKDFNSNNKEENAKVKDYKDSIELSDVFNAYDIVYKYIEEPFSSDLLTIDHFGLFNTCRYLVNKISTMKTNNKQIGRLFPAYVYYALAFLSKQFEAYKTARYSFETLNTLNFPQSWQKKIDYEIISIRSKPYIDKDNNMPLCYRCLNTNPLVNKKGDKCTICSHSFIRSPISQEILPLIEFKPFKEINDDDAIEMVKFSNMTKLQRPMIDSSSLINNNSGNVNMMVIQQDDNQNDDVFGIKLVEWCDSRMSQDEYGIFEVDEGVLKSLNESEIFIVDLRSLCKTYPVKFYKNRMKDIFLTMCKFCYKFFKTEEYENLFLKNNCCPICRNS